MAAGRHQVASALHLNPAGLVEEALLACRRLAVALEEGRLKAALAEGGHRWGVEEGLGPRLLRWECRRRAVDLEAVRQEEGLVDGHRRAALEGRLACRRLAVGLEAKRRNPALAALPTLQAAFSRLEACPRHRWVEGLEEDRRVCRRRVEALAAVALEELVGQVYRSRRAAAWAALLVLRVASSRLEAACRTQWVRTTTKAAWAATSEAAYQTQWAA